MKPVFVRLFTFWHRFAETSSTSSRKWESLDLIRANITAGEKCSFQVLSTYCNIKATLQLLGCSSLSNTLCIVALSGSLVNHFSFCLGFVWRGMTIISEKTTMHQYIINVLEAFSSESSRVEGLNRLNCTLWCSLEDLRWAAGPKQYNKML